MLVGKLYRSICIQVRRGCTLSELVTIQISNSLITKYQLVSEYVAGLAKLPFTSILNNLAYDEFYISKGGLSKNFLIHVAS